MDVHQRWILKFFSNSSLLGWGQYNSFLCTSGKHWEGCTSWHRGGDTSLELRRQDVKYENNSPFSLFKYLGPNLGIQWSSFSLHEDDIAWLPCREILIEELCVDVTRVIPDLLLVAISGSSPWGFVCLCLIHGYRLQQQVTRQNFTG